MEDINEMLSGLWDICYATLVEWGIINSDGLCVAMQQLRARIIFSFCAQENLSLVVASSWWSTATAPQSEFAN